MTLRKQRIRITYVLTHHIRWVPFELTALLIDKDEFDIDYIILGEDDPIIDFLQRSNIPVKSKAFTDYSNTPEAVRFVHDHLVRNRSDIVQTHWFAGSLVGLQAAYYANVPVRIFHREHPPIKYYNRHPASKHKLIWESATHFVAVTNKSKAGMIEDGIPAERITVIPTGFNVREFANVNPARITRLREKYLNTPTLQRKGPIIGIAARYVKWKGVEYAIKAFQQVLDKHPQALLVLSGCHIHRTELQEKLAQSSKDDIVAHQYDDALSIIRQTDELPTDSFIEIPFEEDLFALFKLFDIFVHVPIDPVQETFGQVYVEAMLAKVASVVTLSGSALDHAIHRENAWIVDYESSDQISEGIITLLADSELRQNIIANAFRCAEQRYEVGALTKRLEDFYRQCHSCHQSSSEPQRLTQRIR